MEENNVWITNHSRWMIKFNKSNNRNVKVTEKLFIYLSFQSVDVASMQSGKIRPSNEGSNGKLHNLIVRLHSPQVYSDSEW